MKLTLGENAIVQSGSVFDQETDPIDSDLILVMDRFDREEVYKEIAGLDTINPSGYYTSRLKLLGEFGRTLNLCTQESDIMEINDPWYGTVSSDERCKALRVTLRKLLIGCQGLMIYLSMLKDRCLHELPLQTALIQSLRCPVMEHSSLTRATRMNNWRPIWKSKNSTSSGFYTLHHTEGDWCVVRKNMIPRKRYQYWNDVRNVENELRNWMRQHKSLNRLPKHRELTETGQFALSRAVIKHGGISAFVSRLHVPCYSKRKKQEGYWQDVANVEKELRDWMQRHDCKKFPTRDALRETGDSALASALRWHGNTEVMAKRLNVRGKQRGRHFWTKDENLKKELLPYLTKAPDGLMFPTQRELQDAQRNDLLGAIMRRGGVNKVAQRFGCIVRKASQRRRCPRCQEEPPQRQRT